MNPNISFIIPSYNAQDTIEESINSIFNGNFTVGDEVIIVNDSSTDGSQKIFELLKNKYFPNVIIINNEINRGCPASRNIGISKAKNDLIFNLDSDNVLPSGSIELLKEGLFNSNSDVSTFQKYHYFKKDINKITHKWICKPGIMSLSDFFSGYMNPGPGGNFLYEKEMWQKIGGYWEYDKGLHEAWGFTFKMLVNGAKIFVTKDSFYFHRYSHNSLFVRESSRVGHEQEITRLFVKEHLEIFDPETKNFIINNQDWFKKLDEYNFRVKNSEQGQNGRLVYMNPIKEILNKIIQRYKAIKKSRSRFPSI